MPVNAEKYSKSYETEHEHGHGVCLVTDRDDALIQQVVLRIRGQAVSG